MTRRLLVALLALLMPALAGPATATAQDATPAGGAATNVRYVIPFGPDGLHPDLNVTATIDGVCGFSSVATLGRPDAWDCISADNEIFDPCFENTFLPPDEPGQVACLESPFTTDVVVLNLTEPLVREKEAMATDGGDLAGEMTPDAADETIVAWDLPWALELANGDRCTLLHGTLIVLAGQVAHYGCADGGFVLGETDRSQPVWTVSYLAEGDFASNLVEITAAWS